MYVLEGLREAIPLYPVYPILFADHGLSTAQISTLFVLWSATSVLLQLPAGALADRVPRRPLLVIAGFVQAIGYSLWILTPSYAGFAVGFVLWGISSSLSSGTFEALVYDELAAVGATQHYGRMTGRSGTIALIADAVATAIAVPLLHFGGFELVGAVSVAVCIAEGLGSLLLPRRPRAIEAGEGGWAAYVETIRSGVREAATHRQVRGLVLMSALLPALTAIDEYVPLLGPAYHLPTSIVPVFLLGLTVAAAIATWCAGRWWSAGGGVVAVAMVCAALSIGASGLIRHPASFTGVAVAFGLLQFGIVATRVRLQHAITGPVRATVTSVADVGAELAAIGVFAACAVISEWMSVVALLATFSLPLLLLAIASRRWLAAGAASSADHANQVRDLPLPVQDRMS